MRGLDFLLVAFPLLFSSPEPFEETLLQVDKESSELRLTEDPARFVLSLDWRSEPSSCLFSAEILDPAERVIAAARMVCTLRPGPLVLSIEIPFSTGSLSGEEFKLLPWYRVRYRIAPEDGAVSPLAGDLFLYDISRDLFQLEFVSPRRARPGSRHQVWVRVINPVAGSVPEGVLVRGSLSLPDGVRIESVGRSGPSGNQVVSFDIPSGVYAPAVRLEISARKGDFVRKSEATIRVARRAQVLIETDKPLYQPGQTVHLRALVFDSDRRAVADAALGFKILDESYTTVHSQRVTTSRYGMAAFDWVLPENVRLGTYAVQVEVGSLDAWAWHRIKVSRYQLPEFVVEAETDREYYLPGQQPDVRISGLYLFGKPIEKGSVRIVREERRSWDFKLQEWQIEKGEELEGELGPKGLFKASLDVEKEFEKLDEWKFGPWGLYRDLTYTAYLTDPTTNRSEERRFDIRITRNEIHLYPIDRGATFGAAEDLYIKAVYADGQPAKCEVLLKPIAADGLDPIRVETNRFGVAKLEIPDLERFTESGDAGFEFHARDKRGRTGRLRSIQYARHVDLFVQPARVLLGRGEPIQLGIRGTDDGPGLLLVLRGDRVIATLPFEIADGKTELSVPFQKEMAGQVSLMAMMEEDLGRYWFNSRPGSVLYPDENGLRIEAWPGMNSYRPSAPVRIDFRTSHPKKGPVQALLGVSVVDRAVHERARNGEGGRRFYGAGRPDRIAGYDIADLVGLSDEERQDPELEPVARALLARHNRYGYRFQSASSRPFESNPRQVFAQHLTSRLREAGVNRSLIGYTRERQDFPRNNQDLAVALRREGLVLSSLLDPWGNAFYCQFIAELPPWGSFSYLDYSAHGDPPRLVPVPQESIIGHVDFRSRGVDGKRGTADDFQVARFSGMARNPETMKRAGGRPWPDGPFDPSSMGSLAGRVLDASGAVIPGAEVEIRGGELRVVTLISDDEGTFRVIGLPQGLYRISVSLAGFRSRVIDLVAVDPSLMTTVDCVLQVGDITETLEISSGPAPIAMAEARISNRPLNGRVSLPALAAGASDTPKLRRYFPETLVWAPNLETDSAGRARLDFKSADNITDWVVRVIGSTEDGRIGIAETGFKTFQPFFLRNDPPPVLTVGDEIETPAVVRNYRETSEDVRLKVRDDDWFTLLEPDEKAISLAGGQSSRSTFRLRVDQWRDQAPLRMSAVGAEVGDAVEKKVAIRPDGQEIVQVSNRFFSGSVDLPILIDDNAIEGTLQGRLKIYPNALSHVLDSVEGILRRPYGCGEQTISSTYPNLIVLRLVRRDPENLAGLRERAFRYLEMGYQRLLGFRDPDGGFQYFRGRGADVALTAYAIRFLKETSPFVEVDPRIIEEAVEWLIDKQADDGRWEAKSLLFSSSKHGAGALTATVAHAIALGAEPGNSARGARNKALDYLSSVEPGRIGPYALALKASVELSAERFEQGRKTIGMLESLRRDRGLNSFWESRRSTPFYGWGLTGRIETTALALRPLLALEGIRATPEVENNIGRGLSFLLENKDRYGVWFSTKATANVLDTLRLADRKVGRPGLAGTAKVRIDGRVIAEESLAPDGAVSGAISVDLSRHLKPGRQEIRIELDDSRQRATAQLTFAHYRRWSDTGTLAQGSDLLLEVEFDRTEIDLGQEILCSVRAERTGSRNYGMMLAEVGLPPGAEVDRSSLEKARQQWLISDYDILPDRLVAYLWPRGGKSSFQFKFRPRLGMRAKSAPSVLYDYYNPQARIALNPREFVVKSKK